MQFQCCSLRGGSGEFQPQFDQSFAFSAEFLVNSEIKSYKQQRCVGSLAEALSSLRRFTGLRAASKYRAVCCPRICTPTLFLLFTLRYPIDGTSQLNPRPGAGPVRKFQPFWLTSQRSKVGSRFECHPCRYPRDLPVSRWSDPSTLAITRFARRRCTI
jgi:hypothetical protein